MPTNMFRPGSTHQIFDLVLIDPASRSTASYADIISKAGWSPYSGKMLRGSVVRVFLRGVET